MNILYLSPDLSDYPAAFYQRDVMEFMEEIHDVAFYGPGFPGYDSDDDIDDIVEKCRVDPDIVCFGHGWLGDDPEDRVVKHGGLDLDRTNLPSVLILNKEYRNFAGKIDFVRRNGIELVFTHHHDADQWSERFDAEFVYWPFAVNHRRFRDYDVEEQFDFTLTGVLRNPDPSVPQTDVRIKVQRRLFYSLGQLRLALKPRYRDLNVFWRARPPNRVAALATRLLHGTSRLPDEEYKKLLARSRTCLNTLSPLGLIGTRYYEAMASNCLVLCERTDLYEEAGVFDPGRHCVTFDPDLSDFDEILRYYLEHDRERERITQRAREHVLDNHTWEDRIHRFTQEVESRFFG